MDDMIELLEDEENDSDVVFDDEWEEVAAPVAPAPLQSGGAAAAADSKADADAGDITIYLAGACWLCSESHNKAPQPLQLLLVVPSCRDLTPANVCGSAPRQHNTNCRCSRC